MTARGQFQTLRLRLVLLDLLADVESKLGQGEYIADVKDFVDLQKRVSSAHIHCFDSDLDLGNPTLDRGC